jgi:hypothetical protein
MRTAKPAPARAAIFGAPCQLAHIRSAKCRDWHRRCRHRNSSPPSSHSSLPPKRNGHAMTLIMHRTSLTGLAIAPEVIP